MTNKERAEILFRNSGMHGSDGRLYLDGPCNGMGYYHGHLWPQRRFTNEADLNAAVELCREAYLKGVEDARTQMRQALGV